MGTGSNVRHRKSKKRASVNSTQRSKKLKRKLVCKKTPSLETVAKNWNFSQTLKQNMDAIGIAYDSNDVVSMKAGHPQNSLPKDSSSCLEALERAAATSRNAKEYTLSKTEKDIFTKLVEKYGDDYKKMAWDKKNVNQLTEGQLRRKCVLLQR